MVPIPGRPSEDLTAPALELRAMAITPPPLRPGDTIAIVPTARAISLEELRDGIALAERWGLKVKLGAGIRRK
jgi:hypothetical protein